MIKKLILSVTLLLSTQSFANFYEGEYIFETIESENCPFFIEDHEVKVTSFPTLQNGSISFNKIYSPSNSTEYIGHHIVNNVELDEGVHYFSSCDWPGRERVQVKKTETSITVITSNLKRSRTCHPRKTETTKRLLQRVKLENGLLYLEIEKAQTKKKNDFELISRCAFKPIN